MSQCWHCVHWHWHGESSETLAAKHVDTASSQTWKAFTEFISGFAAARELHARAGKAGSFVESVCLGASLVDALLRVGLVLQHQLDHRTRDIPLDLVFQGPSEKPVSEREIYRRSRTQLVIDDSIFQSCNASTMIAIV